MSGRAAGPVEIPSACPFLAFEDDREHRSTAPDHRHRCYAETLPAPRAVAHQERYCLSSDFPSCPTFQAWARREAARETTSEGPREVPAGRPPADPGAWLREDAAAAAAGGAPAGAAGPARASTGQLAAFDTLPGDVAGDAELAALMAGAPAEGGAAAAGGPAPPEQGGEGIEAPAFLAGRTGGAAGTRSGRAGKGAPPSATAGMGPGGSQGRAPAATDPNAPPWEPPRRFEAYPTLRSRTSIPSVPPAALALVALVLAAVILFLLPGLFTGPGPGPSGSGSPGTSASNGASVAPSTPGAPTPNVYVVKANDTMTAIAKQFGVTVDDLLAWNPQIKDPNKIKVGDQITIPTPGLSPPVATGSSPP